MKRILAIAVITFLSFKVSAQDTGTDNHQISVVIPNIALLDLESSASKNFTSTFVQPTPLEAGQKINVPANNTDTWLNYSSILPATVVLSRRVDVKLDTPVPGVGISVVAGAATTGFGTKGTPTSAVTLTATNQPLINTIGSAYTASGASNGHNLTYSFTAADANYGNLRAATTVVTVTYTLVDN
ncbi:MAG: hypothetical protein Q8K92_05180 [Leadbetterella sp.]|jgi:hypothetical protein|nr:hypothetical protein [Leadbetterella sp.]